MIALCTANADSKHFINVTEDNRMFSFPNMEFMIFFKTCKTDFTSFKTWKNQIFFSKKLELIANVIEFIFSSSVGLKTSPNSCINHIPIKK